MASDPTMPGNPMEGLHVSTVHFGLGATGRPRRTVHRILIRGGRLEYEDPTTTAAAI
jgi:hypothetical protein